MTRDYFKQILIKLNPDAKVMIEKAKMDLPRVARETAQHCFLEHIKEDKYTIALREQLVILEKTGMFNFED